MTLSEISEKNTTDKRILEHNYVQFYEKYFEPIRDKNLKILEIGIYRPGPNSGRLVGASLKTWYDYFPKAEIYGVDLTRVRFKASNKYELWLKIHNYMLKHGETIYNDKLYYQYTIDEAFTQEFEKNYDEDAAMIKTIEYELDSWENGDTLWWEEEDIEYV